MRDTNRNTLSPTQAMEALERDALEDLDITYPNMATAADGLPPDDDL